MKRRIFAFIMTMVLCASVLVVPALAAQSIINGYVYQYYLSRNTTTVTASIESYTPEGYASSRKVIIDGTATYKLANGTSAPYTLAVNGSSYSSAYVTVPRPNAQCEFTAAQVSYYVDSTTIANRVGYLTA